MMECNYKSFLVLLQNKLYQKELKISFRLLVCLEIYNVNINAPLTLKRCTDFVSIRIYRYICMIYVSCIVKNYFATSCSPVCQIIFLLHIVNPMLSPPSREKCSCTPIPCGEVIVSVVKFSPVGLEEIA